MRQIDFSPKNISRIFQSAVDEAIEQHRLRGEAIAQRQASPDHAVPRGSEIAVSENGKVKIIPPEEITPLKDKLKQRQDSAA